MVCGKKKTSGQAGESRNGTGEGGLGVGGGWVWVSDVPVLMSRRPAFTLLVAGHRGGACFGFGRFGLGVDLFTQRQDLVPSPALAYPRSC